MYLSVPCYYKYFIYISIDLVLQPRRDYVSSNFTK